jgi:hypothetical protein
MARRDLNKKLSVEHFEESQMVIELIDFLKKEVDKLRNDNAN